MSSYGAHLGDIVTAVTYLRHPQYLDVFEDVCAQRSIPKDMPNSVVVADVCRPEWLCEIEATAICPA